MTEPPRPTPIYHITHADNLASMVAHGGLCCDSERDRRQIGIVDIGHRNLKDWRKRCRVGPRPECVLADFVPYYFAPRSPMLYAIKGRRVEQYRGSQETIVHLVSTVEAVVRAGLDFVFTDGHPLMIFTHIFDKLCHLRAIDWGIMRARYWADEPGVDTDRRRRRQAEFLVREFVPWTLVQEIGVMNQRMLDRVRLALDGASHQPPVHIRRDWYFL